MRVIDLGALYVLVGLLCAVTLGRARAGRRHRNFTLCARVADALWTLLVWPLYLPVLLSTDPAGGRRGPPLSGMPVRIADEHQRLLAALDAVREPALERILPSREQVRRLMDHVAGLQAKVAELDEVLAQDEFDAAHADRNLRAAEQTGAEVEAARHLRQSIAVLQGLQKQAQSERDELLALCARLRVQLTLLRFSSQQEGGGDGDIGALTAELLGRIEGASAGLHPGLESVT